MQLRTIPAKQQKYINDSIVFRNRDVDGVVASTFDSIVITVKLRSIIVHRVSINKGSSMNILFTKTFDEMHLDENDLTTYRSHPHGFIRVATFFVGRIKLIAQL